MKSTEKMSEKISKVRDELIASIDMMIALTKSRFEQEKASEQSDKMADAWNAFLNEWKELKTEVQVEVKLEIPEKKKGFSKLGRIARKR